MYYLRYISLILAVIVSQLPVRAAYPVDVEAEAMVVTGNGTFAPYYIVSNHHGIITQPNTQLLDLTVSKRDTLSRHLSYRWAVEGILDHASNIGYAQYDHSTSEWTRIGHSPRAVWLQQLYGRLDYRSLFMEAGLKETYSALLNNHLSSGDLIEGCNARPIPQVRVGFNDFQPIPFTNGWVEIQGEVSYGKMSDNGWLKSHYNYYNDHICLGSFYSYKRCYFRTKPSMPLSLTLGMQVSAFFGGTTTSYINGHLYSVEKHRAGIKEFFKMLIPTGGDEDYYLGNTLGSWDILFTYRAPWGGTFKGYLQKPWETGSGIGFLNGFDGLWGLEYKASEPGYLDGIVVEYLDFTNQSGPIHFDPVDLNFPPITTHTDGEDDYYNNYTYNAYANYGMSMGTPMMRSPIYNTDGYMSFTDNRLRGFHVGATGTLSRHLAYTVKCSYRKSWGAIRMPRINAVHDTSWSLQGDYNPWPDSKRLALTATIAMDRGTLYGNTLGFMIGVKSNLSLFK